MVQVDDQNRRRKPSTISGPRAAAHATDRRMLRHAAPRVSPEPEGVPLPPQPFEVARTPGATPTAVGAPPESAVVAVDGGVEAWRAASVRNTNATEAAGTRIEQVPVAASHCAVCTTTLPVGRPLVLVAHVCPAHVMLLRRQLDRSRTCAPVLDHGRRRQILDAHRGRSRRHADSRGVVAGAGRIVDVVDQNDPRWSIVLQVSAVMQRRRTS